MKSNRICDWCGNPKDDGELIEYQDMEGNWHDKVCSDCREDYEYERQNKISAEYKIGLVIDWLRNESDDNCPKFEEMDDLPAINDRHTAYEVLQWVTDNFSIG